jgi:hypothetical protein
VGNVKNSEGGEVKGEKTIRIGFEKTRKVGKDRANRLREELLRRFDSVVCGLWSERKEFERTSMVLGRFEASTGQDLH